jgi:cyclase
MLTRRIIPCLDVRNGRVVKGRQFRELADVGDPVSLAARYSDEGADELVILDISATLEDRRPFFATVTAIAKRVAIPLTVGGGIRTLDDILDLLRCGADKVSLNSVLETDPHILERAAARVGSQALIGAVDARRSGGAWTVRTRSGTQATALDAVAWARMLADRGAGELLVTSIDMDGMKAGYDVALLAALSRSVSVPVIASGGAGGKEHVLAALKAGNADAVLAASIFHFQELSIGELKTYLRSEGLPIR